MVCAHQNGSHACQRLQHARMVASTSAVDTRQSGPSPCCFGPELHDPEMVRLYAGDRDQGGAVARG